MVSSFLVKLGIGAWIGGVEYLNFIKVSCFSLTETQILFNRVNGNIKQQEQPANRC